MSKVFFSAQGGYFHGRQHHSLGQRAQQSLYKSGRVQYKNLTDLGRSWGTAQSQELGLRRDIPNPGSTSHSSAEFLSVFPKAATLTHTKEPKVSGGEEERRASQG